MNTTYATCPNPECNRGAITTMVGRVIGRTSAGHEVRSETFLVPSNEMCPVCRGRGRITVEIDAEPVETPASAEVVTYCGQEVNAPGFDQDQFERAMLRAFRDDLQVKPYHDGRWIVHHPGLTGGYVVSREACTCPAGVAGAPALPAHSEDADGGAAGGGSGLRVPCRSGERRPATGQHDAAARGTRRLRGFIEIIRQLTSVRRPLVVAEIPRYKEVSDGRSGIDSMGHNNDALLHGGLATPRYPGACPSRCAPTRYDCAGDLR